MNNLNPEGIDFSYQNKLPFFNPVKKYFAKIKLQEANISTLLENLKNEQEILKRDNITLKIEIDKLDKIIEELNAEYKNGELYLVELNKQIPNENKSRFNLDLFEKKLYDFKQMIIVNEQSEMALTIILNNNNEIIRNIDKIKNVSMAALKTSAMVANSIYNQKITLNKINSLDKSAVNLLKDTNSLIHSSKLDKGFSKSQVSDFLQENYNKIIDTLNNAKLESEKCFPENSLKILEIKNEE